MATDASGFLTRARASIDPATRAALARLDPRNRLVAEYHVGFVDAAGEPADAGGGKTIRGGLALLSAEVAGADLEVGLPSAVGVQLIHHYSLLHDDIIDGDDMRRHRPAAWTVFGKRSAILAGDAMAALALEVAGESGGSAAVSGDDPISVSRDGSVAGAHAARALAVATRRMIAGQAADVAFEDRERVSLAECEAMVADKTGALMECAAAVGAIAAGASQDLIEALEAFGRHIGMAFQLVDDIMGIWGAVDDMGKPVASDVASRKKSLPVVAALQTGGPDARRLAELYAVTRHLTPAEVDAAAEAVDAAGGRAWALRRAERESAEALAVVDELQMDDDVRATLHAMAAMLCSRTR